MQVEEFIDDNQHYNFGLLNIGNTCYANSALQMLFSIPELREYLLNDANWEEHLKNICLKHNCQTESDVLNIVKKYYSIILYKFLNNKGDVKNPYVIFGLLDYRNRKIHFNVGEQNDSQEFLSVILNNLNDEFYKLKKEMDIDTEEVDMKSESIVSDLLNLEYTVDLEYLDYDKSETVKQNNLFLILHLKPGFKAIQDSIDHISETEVIDGFYEKVENKTKIKKTVNISKTSEYLLCHIVRFKNNREKNSQPLQILDNIKINNKVYEVVSIVSHSGGIGGGHYINYSNRKGEWFLFNDSNISKVNKEDVLNNCSSGSAYIVMYKLKNKHH